MLFAQPWPWWVAGPLIGMVVPFVFWYGGKKWGVSSSLQHLCAATVPGRIEYFRYDWRRVGSWSLVMVAGVLAGGGIGGVLLRSPGDTVEISPSTRADLMAMGLTDLNGFMPDHLFSWDGLLSASGIVLIVCGGFLVGFGARWANGCTSGHAISGLSTLRRASLAAVIGFFLGGLASAHVLLPLILGGWG